MAEALLRSVAGDRFEVFSAGSLPKGLHPATIATMNEIGIDVSGHRSKSVDEYSGQHFDCVITVCDRARQSCPIFPGSASLHWSFEDPADAPSEQQGQTFRRVREEIRERITSFVIAK